MPESVGSQNAFGRFAVDPHVVDTLSIVIDVTRFSEGTPLGQKPHPTSAKVLTANGPSR